VPVAAERGVGGIGQSKIFENSISKLGKLRETKRGRQLKRGDRGVLNVSRRKYIIPGK
jgi:hypothetical protein